MNKIIILLCAISIFLFSCKKSNDNFIQSVDRRQNVEAPDIKNGRMFFKNPESFYAFIDFLDSKKQEYVDSLSFALTNFHSLLKEFKLNSEIYENALPENHLNDLLSFRFPTSYLYALNTDGEMMIGDTIIWYSNGKKYFIPKENEDEIDLLKKNPKKILRSEICGSSSISFDGNSNSTGTTSRTDIGHNAGRDGKWQKEFWQSFPSSGNRKFVHEMVTYTDGRYSYIYIGVKMEWRGRRNWAPAGEMRDISVNISGYADTYPSGVFPVYIYGPGFLYNFSTQYNSEYKINLAKYDAIASGGGSCGCYPYWTVHVVGTIYQHVVGDAAINAWYNTGTEQSPLW